MAGIDADESSPDVSSRNSSSGSSDVFALLGNETRLAILLALWEEFEPHEEDNTVQFSRIFELVDYDDPGNLRYHLEKLRGQFITQGTDRGGYELRETGLKLVQTVIAGAGVREASIEATEISEPCPFCRASTVVSYQDGLVIHACTECEGAGPVPGDENGLLSAIPFAPVGVENRSAGEIRAASVVAAIRQVQSLFDGLCPVCSSPVDAWLEHCDTHEPTGGCDDCGNQFPAQARFQCQVCKNRSVSPLQGLALFVPTVVAFYDEHGISTRIRTEDPESVNRYNNLMDTHEVALVSRDPPLAEVTGSVDGDEFHVSFDERVRVVDVRR